MCGALFEKRFAISVQVKELCKNALLSLIDRCPEWFIYSDISADK